MPAYCTHYIFACETAKMIENKDIEINSDALLIGTQGPDIFFFHRIAPWMIGKPLRKLGSKLHRTKSGEIVDALAAYCKISSEKSIALSYAYGFLMHFALDSNCHPFVYSLQNKIKDRGAKIHSASIHNIIEMNMDTYMINTHLGIDKPCTFDSACTITTDKKVLNELGKIISYTVNTVTDYKITENDVITAIKDTAYVQEKLHDESGNKRKIVSFLEDIASPVTNNFKLTSMIRPNDLEKAKKYGNIMNGVWESPYEKGKRNESFTDLFELSKADAVKMINEFSFVMDGKITGYDITHNKSFLTGVEVL